MVVKGEIISHYYKSLMKIKTEKYIKFFQFGSILQGVFNITNLIIFSLVGNAQVSHLAHFWRTEKHSEIKPPLTIATSLKFLMKHS